MDDLKRGIAVCTYNRADNLEQILSVLPHTTPEGTRIVVCDDGSNDHTPAIVSEFKNVVYFRGPNLGVGANKNRALVALQDCHLICILEDDLIPTEPGWFELYEMAVLTTDIHHFCRVQDKQVEETISNFSKWMKGNEMTPLFGSSPRGDLTFLTSQVIDKVGGFNPRFKGVGLAHGEWSERVHKAGLIPHPLKWLDIQEARDKLKQIGDTEGGRWERPESEIQEQIERNRTVLADLRKKDYIYHPLVIS